MPSTTRHTRHWATAGVPWTAAWIGDSDGAVHDGARRASSGRGAAASPSITVSRGDRVGSGGSSGGGLRVAIDVLLEEPRHHGVEVRSLPARQVDDVTFE